MYINEKKTIATKKLTYFPFVILICSLLLSGCASISGLADYKNTLAEVGFNENIGFRANLSPGSLIQVAGATNTAQHEQYTLPRLFMPGADCYPDLQVTETGFYPAAGKQENAHGFFFNNVMLGYFLPQLHFLKDEGLSYTLNITKTKSLSFARGKMMGHMSDNCVQALTLALNDGDKLEWFRLVMDVLVVDEIRLELHWLQQTATEKARLKALIKQALNNEASILDLTDSSVEIIFTRRFILAYKAQPLASSVQ